MLLRAAMGTEQHKLVGRKWGGDGFLEVTMRKGRAS